METIIIENKSEIKRNIEELERKLKVNITFVGKKMTIEGESLDEYEAIKILEAINLGFSAKRALTLLEPNMTWKSFNIKEFTRRKNLKDVRARIVGTEGKTKRAIEEISACEISLKENTLSIIGPGESIEEAVTALKNLIRGSKQSNVYKFLESRNTERKRWEYETKHQK